MNRRATPILSRFLRSLPFVLVLLLGGAGFQILSGMRQAPETVTKGKLDPLVQVTEVESGHSVLQLEVDGEVVPFRQVALSAQVAGRIVSKGDSCQAGHYVQRGELLLMIDPRDYDLEVRRIQQLIKQTEVDIEELDVEHANTQELITLAEEDLELQARELERVRTLIERQATSQSALETSQRARIQAVNTRQTLRNQSRLLETRRGRILTDKERLLVELERAMLDRERCEVRAPMEGIVVEDAVEEDDFVQPGGKLLRIEDTDRVEVRFDLKLGQLRWIWESVGQEPGRGDAQRVSYELPSLPVAVSYNVEGTRYVWQGMLSRYDQAGLNPATRTVPCIALVSDPRGGRWLSHEGPVPRRLGPPTLLRGMFVRVKLEVPATQPLLQIPLVALRPGSKVWLVRDEKLAVVDVDVAQAAEDRVLLFSQGSGLQQGDQLVVSPLSLAVDQMRVRVDRSPLGPGAEVLAAPPSAEAPAEVTIRSEPGNDQREVSR